MGNYEEACLAKHVTALESENLLLRNTLRNQLICSALSGVCASSSFGGMDHQIACSIAINRADMTLALMTTTHLGLTSPKDREGKQAEKPASGMADAILNGYKHHFGEVPHAEWLRTRIINEINAVRNAADLSPD